MEKSWYKSVTIWGIVIAVVCYFLSLWLGVPADELLDKVAAYLEKGAVLGTALAGLGLRRAVGKAVDKKDRRKK